MPRISLLPAGLAALLRRREQLLVDQERAAVAAALAEAPPELRARLEELLGRAPGATRGAPGGPAAGDRGDLPPRDPGGPAGGR